MIVHALEKPKNNAAGINDLVISIVAYDIF